MQQLNLMVEPITHTGWIAARRLSDRGRIILRPIPNTFSSVSSAVARSHAAIFLGVGADALYTYGIAIIPITVTFTLTGEEVKPSWAV